MNYKTIFYGGCIILGFVYLTIVLQTFRDRKYKEATVLNIDGDTLILPINGPRFIKVGDKDVYMVNHWLPNSLPGSESLTKIFSYSVETNIIYETK